MAMSVYVILNTSNLDNSYKNLSSILNRFAANDFSSAFIFGFDFFSLKSYSRDIFCELKKNRVFCSVGTTS